MTKHKKILLAFTVLLLLSTVLTVTALADASVAEDGAISYAEGPTDVAPETREDTEADNATEEKSYDEGDSLIPTQGTEGENPMAQMFTAIKEHLAEILSALTLIGSLILAFAFKKGLLPLVRGAIGRLSDSANEAKTSAKETAKETEAIRAEINLRTTAIEDATAAVADTLRALGEEVKELKEQGLDKKLLYGTLGAEVELLYDIFMSSSLPNFQKEAVSQRLTKMKEELTAGEEK